MRAWVHLKRGGKYVEVGPCRLQTDKPLDDMTPLIVYRGEDGMLWARPPHEFEGRFQVIGEVDDEPGYHLNNSNSVAVADDTYYLPMDTCPLGAKVLLLNRGGVAVLGFATRADLEINEWRGWFPLPKERK